MKPTVSIVIPTYNRAHLISRAIRSVLVQTYQDWELLVIDDCSKDNTREVVENLSDSRIRFLWHEENLGGAAARNTGIRNASGDYITFLDSDDEWIPEKLATQITALKEVPQSVGVIYSGFVYVGLDGDSFPPPWDVAPPADRFREAMLLHNFVATPTAVVRRECFDRCGNFDERLPRFQDWELWLRIAKLYAFHCVDFPLVLVYRTPGSISTSSEAKAQALEIILKKHYADMAEYPEILAKHSFEIGKLWAITGRIGKGWRHLFRATRLCPWSSDYGVRALVSVLGKATLGRMLT